MEQTVDRLTEKIQSLTSTQLAEVERLIESLQTRECDREAAHMAAALSTPGLEAIWKNPEDDV